MKARCVTTFVVFPASSSIWFSSVCIAMSLIDVETTHNANEHIWFMSFVLSRFENAFQNVVTIIGDDCSTNQCIANNLSVSFIGYASHKFQLSVRKKIPERKKRFMMYMDLWLDCALSIYRQNCLSTHFCVRKWVTIRNGHSRMQSYGFMLSFWHYWTMISLTLTYLILL